MNTPTPYTRASLAVGRGEVVQQNETFIRQGEWLFVPVPGLVVEAKRILRDEPVRRRAVESHVVEEVFRTGGEAVYFSETTRRVLTVPQFRKLLRQRPAAVKEDWRIRQRDMTAYGRGTVRHPEHRTVTLHGWHRILMHTNAPAQSLTHLAPLDYTAKTPAGLLREAGG